MVLKLNKSRYQVQELTKRWAKLIDETITDSYILQWAIDYKFSLYITSPGLLQVILGTRLELGSPQRKIVAYLRNEFIKLTDDHIRSLLGNKPTTILFANLSESDFIQGEEPFDLSEIEMAILDEKDRIRITPDDISYLSVTAKDVIAFEQKLRRVRNEHYPKSITSTSDQEGALKQIKGTGNDSNQDEIATNQRSYTRWLRGTWIKEGCPGGADFFNVLKKYNNQENSPVINWFNTSPKGPGVELKTNTGEIELLRKQIQKTVSRFKREEKEKKNLSSKE